MDVRVEPTQKEATVMNATTQEQELVAQKVFSRVLVGIDGSEESREAARQAATLTDGELTLLSVYDIASALVGGTGFGVPVYYDEEVQRTSAEDALRHAVEDVEAATPTGKIAKGVAWDALIDEAERRENTLIAVGSHGRGRMAGIVMGSVATEVIHKAPCSVLVARKRSDAFPHKIVVGIDGSAQSMAAYAVAKDLAERFETEWSRSGPMVGSRSNRAWSIGSSATSGRNCPTSPSQR